MTVYTVLVYTLLRREGNAGKASRPDAYWFSSYSR